MALLHSNLQHINEETIIQGLIRVYNGEVNQYNRHSTLMSAYRHIKDPKFMYSIIREKGEVYKALKQFFGKKEIDVK